MTQDHIDDVIASADGDDWNEAIPQGWTLLVVVTEPKFFSLYGSSKLVYGDVFSLSGFPLPDEWAV